MRGPSLSIAAQLAVALVAAAPALGQAEVTELTIDGKTSLTNAFNREDCETTTTMPLRLRVTVDQPSYYARFVLAPSGLPGGACPSDMEETELIEVFAAERLDALSGVLELDRNVTPAQLMTEAGCDEVGVRFSGGTLCLQLTVNANDPNAVAVQGIAFDFDTTVPPAITIDEVTPGDASVTLAIGGIPSDEESYTILVEYRACAADDVADAGALSDAGSAGDSLCGATGDYTMVEIDESATVEIKGLDNDARIEARVSLRDDFDNVGPLSALTILEPMPDLGTLDLYDGHGGDLSCSPSCGAGATTASAASVAGNGGLVAVLVFGISRRGRRLLARALRRHLRRAGGAALLLAAALAQPALGDFGQQTLSLGVSPYKPAIDQELVDGDQRIFPVYSCLFEGATLVEFGGDADTHLFDGFGSLQLSIGLNFSQARGKAQPTSVLVSGECAEPTTTDLELTMLKLRPGLSYRADQLLDSFGVPLVPYGRIGLVTAGYAFTKKGAFETGGVDPVGLRFGWEAGLGLMLALDFLDAIDPFVPDTTRRARANGTFDHTFFFVEGAWQELDTFGRPGLVLSPDDAFLGTRLPVMWKLGVAVELL